LSKAKLHKPSSYDSWGRLATVSPFEIEVPGIQSRLGLWPTECCPWNEAGRERYKAWLKTLWLEHLRCLQDRVRAFQDSIANQSPLEQKRLDSTSTELHKLEGVIADAIASNKWEALPHCIANERR